MRGGWVILHIWNSCQVPGFFQSHDPFDVSRSQLAFCLQFLHKVKDQLITLHSICVTPGGVEKTFLLPKNSRFWREWLSACLSLSYQSSLIFLTLPPLSLIPPPSLFLSHSSSLTTSTSPFLTRPSSLIPQHSSFLTLPSHLISHPSSFTPPYALLLLYPLSFTPPSPLISLPWPLLLEKIAEDFANMFKNVLATKIEVSNQSGSATWFWWDVSGLIPAFQNGPVCCRVILQHKFFKFLYSPIACSLISQVMTFFTFSFIKNL